MNNIAGKGISMEWGLQVRRTIIGFYKQYELPASIILKLFIGFFIYYKLSWLAMGHIGVKNIMTISLSCSIITAFAPPFLVLVVAMAAATLFLSYASIEIALFAIIVFFLITAFYARLFSFQSLLIPAMLVAYYFKVPYAVAIFAGIYLGVSGIIPVSIGTFLWWCVPYIKELAKIAPRADFVPLTLPDSFIEVYEFIFQVLKEDTTWIISVIILSAGVIIATIITKMHTGYSKGIAATVSGIFMLFAYLIAIIFDKVTIGMIGLLLGSFISIALIMLITFFDVILDYPRSERVEFEDNENYYYVKVVPKVLIDEDEVLNTGKGNKSSKRTNTIRKTPSIEMYEKRFQDGAIKNRLDN